MQNTILLNALSRQPGPLAQAVLTSVSGESDTESLIREALATHNINFLTLGIDESELTTVGSLVAAMAKMAEEIQDLRSQSPDTEYDSEDLLVTAEEDAASSRMKQEFVNKIASMSEDTILSYYGDLQVWNELSLKRRRIYGPQLVDWATANGITAPAFWNKS